MLCSGVRSLNRIAANLSTKATTRSCRRVMTTQSHYEAHSASTYESAYFYSPGAYTDYLTKLVVSRLGLRADTKRRVLDIGGGTGNFTNMMVENSPDVEAIVVDPFLEGGEESAAGSSVKFVHAPAEMLGQSKTDEMWWRQDYQQVLMKEVIHHLDAKDRVAVFTGIHKDLPKTSSSTDPNILIITRPQIEIDYPLWKEAKQVWAKNQPSQTELESELGEAGFSRVTNSIEAYPCEIEFERWMTMVKGRFWSTFSNFTDEELDAACERMRIDEAKRISDKGVIQFEDRLVFISAYK